MKLKIIKGDITKIECDAIVSSTNEELLPFGDIDSAISNAAGPELKKACLAIGKCEVGNCVITMGYNLPCKYIIHAVTPNVYDNNSSHYLSQCYKNAIKKASIFRIKSITFPLIGIGDNEFPLKKALKLAFNSIGTVLKNKNDLLINFVVPDEESMSLALMYAYESFSKEYILNDISEIQNINDDNEINLEYIKNISLCKVNPPDKNNNIWLIRYTNLIDGKITHFNYDKNLDSCYDNRKMIFCTNGPNTNNAIGFWQWYEEPKHNKPEESQTVSHYIDSILPIEIITFADISKVEDIVERLLNGVEIPTYTNSRILFTSTEKNSMFGVLCDLDDFIVNKKYSQDSMFIELKSSVHSLTYYNILNTDIYNFDNRKVYIKTEFDSVAKVILINIPVNDVRQTVVEHFLNWINLENYGITDTELNNFRNYILNIPENNIIDKLSITYNLNTEDAKHCCNVFLKSIDKYFSNINQDSDLFINIINNHSDRRDRCYKIAENKWKEEHNREIEKAHQEIEEILNTAIRDEETAKKRLAEIEASVSKSEEELKKVLADIENAQTKLEYLLSEIKKYETLERDTLAAMRSKISEAQNDMASFIAELSVFLPQTLSKSNHVINYTHSKIKVSGDDIDFSKSWNEEFNSFYQNISECFDIDSQLRTMLAAFLYAAHINKLPILIVGPFGSEIADVLSGSLYANGSGVLTLSEECNQNTIDEIHNINDSIIVVRNMFGKGWTDSIPQYIRSFDRQVIWTHPYAEDLIIEPKGLFNYMIPVLSECFINSYISAELIPCKRNESYKQFVSNERSSLCLNAFNKLKLSKIITDQLEKVFSDAKKILNNTSKEKDFEFLFGVLPFAVLIDRIDVLEDVLENENGLSNLVKKEAQRYITDK